MNYFDVLPNEMIYEIGTHLNLLNLFILHSSCQRFLDIFNNLKKERIINIPIKLTLIDDVCNPERCAYHFVQ